MALRTVALAAGLVLAGFTGGCQPRQGNEPIVAAVALDDAAQVTQYLAEGGDPDFKSRAGDPLIYIASGPRGGVAVAELLVEAGADVNAVSAEGRPPLHNAAAWCDLEMARLLLAAGADITKTGKNGEGVLDVICQTPEDRREAMVALLNAARASER